MTELNEDSCISSTPRSLLQGGQESVALQRLSENASVESRLTEIPRPSTDGSILSTRDVSIQTLAVGYSFSESMFVCK